MLQGIRFFTSFIEAASVYQHPHLFRKRKDWAAAVRKIFVFVQHTLSHKSIEAVRSFIHTPQDIIIQVLPNKDRFISLDGHTRLYYAVMKGWKYVRAVAVPSDDWTYKFVSEAQKRGIYVPNDMTLVSHAEYEEKWDRFCNDLFADDRIE